MPDQAIRCSVCGAEFTSQRRLGGHLSGKHQEHIGVKASTVDVGNLSESQKGYIAAFLDGEGGIQITLTKRKDRECTTALHPDVYFTNTDERAIQALRSWVGGGSVTKRREAWPHKDTHVLTISGVRSILELLSAIRPMLIIKASRADVMMEYCRSRLLHYRGKGRQFTENELRLYTTTRQLNRRGGGAKKRQPTVV